MGVVYGDSEEVKLSGETNILSELEDKSIYADYGCRSASCGVCACKVLEGSEALSPADPVEQDTISYLDKRDFPVRLICRAQVVDINARIVLKSYHS